MTQVEKWNVGDVASEAAKATAALPADNAPQDAVEEEIIAAGRLDARQIAQARAVQRRHQSSFAEAAVSLGFIRREHLLQALAKRFNYPILSHSAGSANFSRELVVGFDAFGLQAEALRSIRAGLVSAASEAKVNSIAFIGPNTGAGVSFLSSNMALSLAQAGVRTLLVDANFRRPRVNRIFGLPQDGEGLVEWINRGAEGRPPIVEGVVTNLSVLTAGFTPPNPQELLVSPEFVSLVQDLRTKYGVVIYDTTNTADCVDGLMVASRAGAAVIVGRRHKTRFAEVRKLASSLRTLNCVLLGSVLDA